MTIDEFLYALTDRRERFTINDMGYIRCEDGRCPIEVMGDETQAGYQRAAHKLALSEDDAYDIQDAADDPTSKLRARLRTACGLHRRDER